MWLHRVLVNAINSLLGSYGTTIDLDNVSNQYAGNDAEFVEFVSEMNSGAVDAVFFLNANPVYDYHNAGCVKKGLEKSTFKSIFRKVTMTKPLNFVMYCAKPLLPESWGDDNAIEGYYTVVQPTINPVYNTRQAEQA
jgi:hypothetical protein